MYIIGLYFKRMKMSSTKLFRKILVLMLTVVRCKKSGVAEVVYCTTPKFRGSDNT